MKNLVLTLLSSLGAFGMFAQIPPCNLSFVLSTPPCTFQTITLTNNSTFPLLQGFNPVVLINWGDNTSQSISYPNFQGGYQPGLTYSHTYTNAGTYTISLAGSQIDSASNITVCSSTITQQTTIVAAQNTSITKVNNGGGSYTFTANTQGGGTGLVYTWNFDDGTPTTTGPTVTHTYSNPGGYDVMVNGNNGTCQYTAYANVQYYNGSLNCNLDTLNFGYGFNGFFDAVFWNSSYYPNLPAGIKRISHWTFGDGNSQTDSTYMVSHTYLSSGTYNVTLLSQLKDSATNNILCTSTSAQAVYVAPPPNTIQGNIYYDSVSLNLAQATFKVWLIVHNTGANTLTAVDSTTVTSVNSVASYTFSNHPTGSYLTKVAPLAGTLAAASIVPTYHASNLYWNSASTINHVGLTSVANISMQNGIPTYGPGFIGGNISQGANKSSGAGVPNLLVALLNANNQIVRFTYTDANGDYSFGNLGFDTYIVFPESMNYLTTPSSGLTVSGNQTTITGVHFKHTTTEIKPYPTGINDLANEDLFSIYPNPTKGSLQINWKDGVAEDAQISVEDITGRSIMTLKTKTHQPSGINLSELQSGVYFIKVSSDNAMHIQKVILQR